MWDLRSLCQTISVKTWQAFANVLPAHAPDSQLTSRKESKEVIALLVLFFGTNYPFSKN